MDAEIIYFSATGTTQKIVSAFAEGFGDTVRFINITKPINREKPVVITGSVIVIAVPVYGERIPEFIYKYLKQTDGCGRPLVVISVYGNMGYGFSVAQFARLAEKSNFRLIAAGMFIGEHSYACEDYPVALGRPDEKDLNEARKFGQSVEKKLSSAMPPAIDVSPSRLPELIFNHPDSGVRYIIKRPDVDETACSRCGVCATKCPVAAIDRKTLSVDEKKCVRCFACVKSCPKNARRSEFRLKQFGIVFSQLGKKPKENIIII